MNLLPVQNVLGAIHSEFFRLVDQRSSSSREVISPVYVFKDLLRREMSHRIADNILIISEVSSGPTQRVDSNGIPFSV